MINYIIPYLNWNWGNPRVPALYWDVYSQEERWKKICLQMQKILDYVEEEVVQKFNDMIDAINKLDEDLQQEVADRILADEELRQYLTSEIQRIEAIIGQLNWLDNFSWTQDGLIGSFITKVFRSGTTENMIIPESNPGANGLMPKSMWTRLDTIEADIVALQGVGRIAANLGQTPTQQQLLDEWQAQKHTAPQDGATIVNLDQDAPSGHSWTYLNGVWYDRGSDTVGIMSNTNSGVAKTDGITTKVVNGILSAFGQVYTSVQQLVENVIIKFNNADGTEVIATIPHATDALSGVLTKGEVAAAGSIVNKLFFDDYSLFPTIGDNETLYIATNTNQVYYWNGTSYVQTGSTYNPVDVNQLFQTMNWADSDETGNTRAQESSMTHTYTIPSQFAVNSLIHVSVNCSIRLGVTTNGYNGEFDGYIKLNGVSGVNSSGMITGDTIINTSGTWVIRVPSSRTITASHSQSYAATGSPSRRRIYQQVTIYSVG